MSNWLMDLAEDELLYGDRSVHRRTGWWWVGLAARAIVAGALLSPYLIPLAVEWWR